MLIACNESLSACVLRGRIYGYNARIGLPPSQRSEYGGNSRVVVLKILRPNFIEVLG